MRSILITTSDIVNGIVVARVCVTPIQSEYEHQPLHCIRAISWDEVNTTTL